MSRGEGGFVIEQADEYDFAFRIAGVDDVNGDGLDDFVVGAGGADNNALSNSGTAYVVFGKTDTDPVHLGDFDMGIQGDQGFRIDGPYTDAYAGYFVSPAGDMNGDGLADIVVAAPGAERTYVVYGKRDPAPINLAALEPGSLLDMPLPDAPLGFAITTRVRADANLSYAVAGGCDVNGDDIPDVVIRLRERARWPLWDVAYVVFGAREASPPVDVRELGDRGFAIRGSFFGGSMACAGDLNGDGKDDILVGEPYTDPHRNRVFVVFGKVGNSTIKVRHLGKRGYVIRGTSPHDRVGGALANGGDIDGDGIPDAIVGAPGALSPTGDGRSARGAVYVVYGQRGTKGIDLRELGRHGYIMRGGRKLDFVGSSVAGPRDVNGDGVPDILIGSNVGHAYLVWGWR